MDLYTQYAIVAAKEAIADSEMDLEKEDLNKIGVIYGVGIGGIHTFEEEVLGYAQTKDTIGPKFSPFFIPMEIPNMSAGQIAIATGLKGPNNRYRNCMCYRHQLHRRRSAHHSIR